MHLNVILQTMWQCLKLKEMEAAGTWRKASEAKG